MCLLATTPPEQLVPSASACGTAQLLISQRPNWLLPMQTTQPGLEQDTAPLLQLPDDMVVFELGDETELKPEPAAGAGASAGGGA